jgi:hypothetical protein
MYFVLDSKKKNEIQSFFTVKKMKFSLAKPPNRLGYVSVDAIFVRSYIEIRAKNLLIFLFSFLHVILD